MTRPKQQPRRARKRRLTKAVPGRLRLQLSSPAGAVDAPIELVLVGDDRHPYYLGAYAPYAFHGAINESATLLRWLEEAARRVRKRLRRRAPRARSVP